VAYETNIFFLTRKFVSGIQYPFNSDKTNAQNQRYPQKLMFTATAGPTDMSLVMLSAGILCRSCQVVTCNTQPSVY